jgi:gamma-glutamylcyclotransferase (GGCT)/AIG2-like uncharacterized protein YtfP
MKKRTGRKTAAQLKREQAKHKLRMKGKRQMKQPKIENEYQLYAIMIVVILLLLIAVVVSGNLLGCDEQECSEDELRCNKSELEICNGDRDWEVWGDCADIVNIDGSDEKWVCCETEAFCTLESECL